MTQPIRFAYTSVKNLPDALMPRLSLTLYLNTNSLEVNGLLDTGSAMNMIPYSVGIALGAVWEEQTVSVPLVGVLGRYEARGLGLLASHPQLTPKNRIRLVFAWTKTDDVPVIFCQTNFFAEFDMCFYRSQGFFEIYPH